MITKERRREIQRKYCQSEKGKMTIRKRRNSKEFKEKNKVWQKKYSQKEKSKRLHALRQRKYMRTKGNYTPRKPSLRPPGIHYEQFKRNGLAKIIFERDNYKCQTCDIKHGLTIHHIDGMGRNSKIKNNLPENLITLCRSCHGRLHSKKYWQERRNAKS